MEFFLVFFEFHFIQNYKRFWIYILIPLILGVCVYKFSDYCLYMKNATNYHSNIINILGILIGFTISVLAIILSAENENIKTAKATYVKNSSDEYKKIYSRNISLYEDVTISLVYIIIFQGILLIANFIYPIFIDITSIQGKLCFSINISIMTYIILLLVRKTLDLYFILTRKD
jgi:hypothetical protein